MIYSITHMGLGNTFVVLASEAAWHAGQGDTQGLGLVTCVRTIIVPVTSPQIADALLLVRTHELCGCVAVALVAVRLV